MITRADLVQLAFDIRAAGRKRGIVASHIPLYANDKLRLLDALRKIARKLNRQQNTLVELSDRVAQMIAELDRDS